MYFGHGHVFANTMTGNMVLMGVNFLAGSWHTALHHLSAILAFLLGVGVSEAIQLRSKARGIAAPYARVLLFESAMLLSLGFVPAMNAGFLFIIGIAFTASVQVETFRELHGHTYNSTYTTGNLRTLGESALQWLLDGHRPDALRVVRDFSFICAAFLIGATAGAFGYQTFGDRALWCDALLLFVTSLRVRRFGRVVAG